ncbi:MAG: HAMP domain-containing histidine kinase [Sphingomonas sp.]|nr:HAMP domain-containing histidine kinase [Sphingomonas sp.]
MRFDDSLSTVLATDASTPFGAQTAWRQLVDLVGRGRAEATPETIAKLRDLRARVPARVRAASARALTYAMPPAPLVRLFAEDDATIAGPVLRSARLPASDWTAMLVAMSAQGRAILRHRRDLPPEVMRALSDFGAVDFVLATEVPTAPPTVESLPVAPGVRSRPAAAWDALVADLEQAETTPTLPSPALDPAPLAESDFASFASVAQALPAVVEARRQVAAGEVALPPVAAQPVAAPAEAPPGPFQIPDIVARIDAFRRQRGEAPSPALALPVAAPALAPTVNARSFQFETDADGIIRWVAGVERAAVIGISIAYGAAGAAAVDGIATGAFRRRARLDDARLEIAGQSSAAGAWRISAIPCFDRISGAFIGYRGAARRPRADEQAHIESGTIDSLRQLVHELRTPTTAIAGFAEMIEGQVLGPVADSYRGYAGTIVEQARALLGAIDDLDLATRIESHALDLRPTDVPLAPILVRVIKDLEPLAALRGAETTLDIGYDVLAKGDDRVIERLLARLIAVLVSAARAGETIAVLATREDGDAVVRLTRPEALAVASGNAPSLAIDAEEEAAAGAPLLGSGFALRLAMNLARELGGALIIGEARLTLRLPAAFAGDMGQASTN